MIKTIHCCYTCGTSSFLTRLIAMRETKEALENISSSLEVLQDETGRLQASLSGERASLSNTLSDPACTNGAVSHTCNAIRSTLAQLGISADYSEVKTGKSNVTSEIFRSGFNDDRTRFCLSAPRCQSCFGQRQRGSEDRSQQHRTEG